MVYDESALVMAYAAGMVTIPIIRYYIIPRIEKGINEKFGKKLGFHLGDKKKKSDTKKTATKKNKKKNKKPRKVKETVTVKEYIEE